jgi:solute carrier family 25 citrate transporter 1
MSVPKTGSRFGAYEFARNSLFPEDSWGKDSRLRSLFCGLTAGVTEAIVAVTPMETVKTKLIHDKVAGTGKYNGLIGGVTTIVKLEGFGGLYRGKYIFF